MYLLSVFEWALTCFVKYCRIKIKGSLDCELDDACLSGDYKKAKAILRNIPLWKARGSAVWDWLRNFQWDAQFIMYGEWRVNLVHLFIPLWHSKEQSTAEPRRTPVDFKKRNFHISTSPNIPIHTWAVHCQAPAAHWSNEAGSAPLRSWPGPHIQTRQDGLHSCKQPALRMVFHVGKIHYRQNLWNIAVSSSQSHPGVDSFGSPPTVQMNITVWSFCLGASIPRAWKWKWNSPKQQKTLQSSRFHGMSNNPNTSLLLWT